MLFLLSVNTSVSHKLVSDTVCVCLCVRITFSISKEMRANRLKFPGNAWWYLIVCVSVCRIESRNVAYKD